jgi:hypothetical protein
MGGMLAQQVDTLELSTLCHANGKPVASAGQTQRRAQVYSAADFRVLGEAEGIIGDYIAAWEAGERSGRFTASKFIIDVTMSPFPRFELLSLSTICMLACSIHAAARPRANSVTSSDCPALCRAPRRRGKSGLNPEMVHKILGRLSEAREPFWQAFVNCSKSNPAALRYIVT